MATQTQVITIPVMPRIHTPRDQREPAIKRFLLEDTWLVVTIVVALVASILAWHYAFEHQLIMLYRDAHAHIDIARRIIRGTSPGLAQLGGVWLPLPHLIMVPLIWNDYLWRTGLAGSFTSMICFVVATIYLYQSARRLTHNGMASFLGALVFICNPGILYLQSTPLSELTLIATMTATCYYFIVWSQEDRLPDLIRAAGAAFFMTIARYDGWAVYLAMLGGIVVIGWLRHHPRNKIFGNLVMFGSLGGLAILLWLVWNEIIFHDPLYFQHSVYSSQTQQAVFIQVGNDRTYHNIWYAFHDYLVVTLETAGPLVFGLGLLALLVYLARRRLKPETIGALMFLVPFPFYVFSLYSGQALIFAPGAAPSAVMDTWYNVRYGVGIVAPIGLFTATLLAQINFARVLAVGLIGVQAVLTFHGGILALQDGQFGFSCYPYSVIPNYLTRHYDGGYILDDAYKTQTDLGAAAGVTLQSVIYQGSGKLWDEALNNPAGVVQWIIVAKGDAVSHAIDIDSQAFNSEFQPLIRDYTSGAVLYHRRGLPPLPTRDLPPDQDQQVYRLCGTVPLYKPHPVAPTTSGSVAPPAVPSKLTGGRR